jgi:hypothetical protein
MLGNSLDEKHIDGYVWNLVELGASSGQRAGIPVTMGDDPWTLLRPFS